MATVPRHPSSGTPHSAVYSVTYVCTDIWPRSEPVTPTRRKTRVKKKQTDRHAPVFILKHVQEDLFTLELYIVLYLYL